MTQEKQAHSKICNKLTKMGGKTGTHIPRRMGDNETQLKHISDQ